MGKQYDQRSGKPRRFTAETLTWRGILPTAQRVETTYEKGIKVLPDELKHYQLSWQWSPTLPKWDVTITPS